MATLNCCRQYCSLTLASFKGVDDEVHFKAIENSCSLFKQNSKKEMNGLDMRFTRDLMINSDTQEIVEDVNKLGTRDEDKVVL